MLRVYRSEGEALLETGVVGEKGSWAHLINPTPEEVAEVTRGLGVPADFVEYPLDEEETSRIEAEDGCVLIIIRVPVNRGDSYDTVPLGVIITENCIATVCLEDTPVLNELYASRPRGFYTFKKTRFLLHLFYRTASQYLRYLREIDKRSEALQQRLHRSTRNEELIRLLGLEKSLVYFTTSLRANHLVMEKLLKSHLAKDPELSGVGGRVLKMYDEDQDLLEDAIVENRQAIEMSEIYTQILSSTMDAFASVISNNLNVIMKFLTVVTIVLAIPTMLASFYGMNVGLPFQDSPLAFAGIVLLSLLLSSAVILVLRASRML